MRRCSADEIEDVGRIVVLDCPVVRVVHDLRLFVSLDLIGLDDPIERRSGAKLVVVCQLRNGRDRDLGVEDDGRLVVDPPRPGSSGLVACPYRIFSTLKAPGRAGSNPAP